MVDPLSASAWTLMSQCGSHAAASAVVASRAARLYRVWPPAELKTPPAYTSVGGAHRPPTKFPVSAGFQELARPVEALSAAIRFRDCPPIQLKNPPTHAVRPTTEMTFT